MGLPSLLPALKKTGTSRSFLALDIGDDTVVSALWHVEQGKLVVRLVSDPVEWSDEDGGLGLPEAADAAIGELGQQAEKVDEVLLGLPETWTSKGFIIPDRKKQLKEMRDMLGLKLLGFAVSTEALVKYVALLDGASFSGLTVEFRTSALRVVVIREGSIERTEVVGRSEDVVGDVTEALARVRELEPEPRVLLFGMKFSVDELKKFETKLVEKNWAKDGLFSKNPTFESLPNDVLVTAVCLTAGREVAAGLGLLDGSVPTPVVKPKGGAKAPESPQASIIPEQVTVSDKKEQTKSNLEDSAPSEENFGFTELTQDSEHANIIRPSEEDLSGSAPVKEFAFREDEEDLSVGMPEEKIASREQGFGARISGFFKKASYGSSLTERHAAEATGKKPVLFLILFIVLLVAGATAAGAFWLRESYSVRVVLKLKMQDISKNVQLKLSPSVAKSDPALLVVKVADASEEVSGKKEGNSSGKKIVGDKAKGKVTVFNRTMNEKSFPAKTVLSYKNLKFTLDEAVTIPPATTGTGYTTVPGSVNAMVTAVNIGSESNLEKSIELVIANFDTAQFVASVMDPLLGGSSREILAVSESDVKRVQEELAKELQAQVISAMQKKAEGGKTVVSAGKPVVKEVSVTPEVGQESNTFEVSITMMAKGIVYSSEDLLPVAENALQSIVPEKAVLRPENTKLSVLNASPSASGEIIAEVELSSQVIPFVDRESIANAVRGTNPADALRVLRAESMIQDARLQFMPGFAEALFGIIPSNLQRIEVEVHVGES